MRSWGYKTLGTLWLCGLRLAYRIFPSLETAFAIHPATRSTEPFLFGVNLPWLSYGNDFGCSKWHPGGGVASDAGKTRLEHIFSGLVAREISCVRWFLFADGRAGILTDTAGYPLGLDDHVFSDLDQAVATAERFGIRILFVVFDFHLGVAARRRQEVLLGGRSGWITAERHRTALLTRVLEPVLHR